MAEDPHRAFNFMLLIEGVSAAGFVECSGLGADIDVIAYREGGGGAVRHLPGQARTRPMILRYGLTRSRAMWDWFETSSTGAPDRRNVSLVMLDADGATEAMRWNLMDAWVSGWQAARLDALAGEVAIESMTVVYDRVDRD